MGLDMYLISLPKIEGMDYEEVHIANAYLHQHETEQNETYQKLKPYVKHFEEYGRSWDSILEEVAYWRKANQIHHWFVETLHNGEDEPCFTQEVTKDNLIDLNNLCIKVLKKKSAPQNILPTRPGCFFGNLHYNDFYYKEIYETQALLAYLITHFNFETHYLLYQCSW
ncbi:hypothetical protein [Neobacillus sp. FSL H8-0543]|uniref:hypothetical protein n=1 Tax=Neobacillus sp. FSL H8-0543 TaxID=2954672 RepID=UPI00315856DC